MLLEDDIFSFWRTLTDSETLAKRIVQAARGRAFLHRR